MENKKLEREVKKENLLGEVRKVGEGLHWTVVPFNNEKIFACNS